MYTGRYHSFYHIVDSGIAANPLFMRVAGHLDGAGEMNRTPDLLITNELLYRLSYTGF
jgi:hypothetical protein